MESRQSFWQYLEPTLFAVAKDEMKEYPDTWKQYMTMRTSKKAWEESGFISGMGYATEKGEGEAVTYDRRIAGPVKRWVHGTRALGLRVTQEAMEDGLFGIMERGMRDLSRSLSATRHLEAARMLVAGNATTYHTGGDGKALFASDHPILGGGTWDNLGTAATPTESVLTAAIQNFETMYGPMSRGKKYDKKAMTIICGPSLEFRFAKLLESPMEPDTANNAVNAVRRLRNLTLVVESEITDDAWFVMGKKDKDVGFIHFDRVRPTVSRHGDPDTGDVKFIGRYRESNECNNPESMYMIPA